MKRLVAACLCWIFCCLLVTEGLCASSRSAFPFRAAFSHYADNENICTVLSAFARAEGYGSVCSPALKGQMSGRFVSPLALNTALPKLKMPRAGIPSA